MEWMNRYHIVTAIFFLRYYRSMLIIRGWTWLPVTQSCRCLIRRIPWPFACRVSTPAPSTTWFLIPGSNQPTPEGPSEAPVLSVTSQWFACSSPLPWQQQGLAYSPEWLASASQGTKNFIYSYVLTVSSMLCIRVGLHYMYRLKNEEDWRGELNKGWNLPMTEIGEYRYMNNNYYISIFYSPDMVAQKQEKHYNEWSKNSYYW